jgi:hypothetical protein
MEYFKVLVLIVHISAAAVLFGVPLGLTRMVRGALAKGSETFKHNAFLRGSMRTVKRADRSSTGNGPAS